MLGYCLKSLTNISTQRSKIINIKKKEMTNLQVSGRFLASNLQTTIQKTKKNCLHPRFKEGRSGTTFWSSLRRTWPTKSSTSSSACSAFYRLTSICTWQPSTAITSMMVKKIISWWCPLSLSASLPCTLFFNSSTKSKPTTSSSTKPKDQIS